MGKLRIACHVITWGGLGEQWELVFREIAAAGYEGVEAVVANTGDELVQAAALARSHGLQLCLVHGKSPRQMIQFNAALGNRSVEIWEGPREEWGGPDLPHEQRFPLVAEFFRPWIAEAARYGMTLHHHIHLGQLVVTNQHVDLLVKYLPEMGILLDTGHLTAAGGDALQVVRDHGPRIKHVHLKDFHRGTAAADYERPDWSGPDYFAPLGEGNTGLDIPAVLRALEDVGYDGWISVELDPQPGLMSQGRPVGELIRASREYLRSLGY